MFGTPLQLRGQTGIRIGGGWVQAFYLGKPIAGLSFATAKWYDDSGKSWLRQVVSVRWGGLVAQAVEQGGVVVDE